MKHQRRKQLLTLKARKSGGIANGRGIFHETTAMEIAIKNTDGENPLLITIVSFQKKYEHGLLGWG
jgi:hypothetical protein